MTDTELQALEAQLSEQATAQLGYPVSVVFDRSLLLVGFSDNDHQDTPRSTVLLSPLRREKEK